MKDKVVIVTGAAGGLGRTFALAFAEKGAKVVGADLNEEALAETVALIKKNNGEAIATGVDVTKEASTEAMIKQAIDTYKRVDVLVNNAAIYAGLERKPFFEISPDTWDQVMAVNLKGPWLCAKAVYPQMKAQQSGSIINIASATVFSGSPLWAHYVSSKSGVIGLTRVLAREMGEDNITVNAIAPGFTLTDASLGLIEDAETYGISRGAIKRSSQPNDMVGAALFLASKDSDFMSGQTLVIDGGKQFI